MLTAIAILALPTIAPALAKTEKVIENFPG